MATTIAEDVFFIDREAVEGLQLQLRQSVASSILSGRLRVGDRLPSSRRLANHLKISRITVTLAFQELAADGYLESRDRSGYYVAKSAPVARIQSSPRRTPQSSIDWSNRFARETPQTPLAQKVVNWREFKYPFVYGQTDAEIFNHSAWRSCAHRALGRRDFHALAGDFVAEDDPELVDFIARHTLPRRGIAADKSEILITMGAQNALWIVSHLMLRAGRKAVTENPGYPGLFHVLHQTGCAVDPVDVDIDGLPPEQIDGDADLVFVTASHQAPTTVTMPMSRRRALLARAKEKDFLVVEDDYEFEMSFLKPPHPSLKSLDEDGRVIYIGSFSKSLFPGLRLGYIVAPAEFIAEARVLRGSILRHPPGHIQRTTAYFLALGHYDALIRRMRDTFQSRREVMMQSIAELGLTPSHASGFGGTSVWMKAPEGVDTKALEARVRKHGVLIEHGHPFFADTPAQSPYYRLAYSSISRDRIADGLALLAKEIEEMASKAPRTQPASN